MGKPKRKTPAKRVTAIAVKLTYPEVKFIRRLLTELPDSANRSPTAKSLWGKAMSAYLTFKWKEGRSRKRAGKARRQASEIARLEQMLEAKKSPAP